MSRLTLALVAAYAAIAAAFAPDAVAARIVCPGIALKVGPVIELPCGRGAKVVKATSVVVDGAYCAKVTYIVERGTPSRTETLCEGDVPTVGLEPRTASLPE